MVGTKKIYIVKQTITLAEITLCGFHCMHTQTYTYVYILYTQKDVHRKLLKLIDGYLKLHIDPKIL